MNIQLHTDEDFDKAIVLVVRGDEIHVKSTENVTPEDFLEIIMAAGVSMTEILETAHEALNRMKQ